MATSFNEALRKLLPADIPQELQRNIEAFVQGQLEQMQLATREQLEIQEKVLKRAINRMEELEKLVQQLENQIKQQ